MEKRLKSRFSVCLAVVFALTAAAACGRKEDKIDLGTIKGSVYKNSYFGFSVRLPDTWQIQDNETRQMLMTQGRRITAGSDKEIQESLDASALQTVNLLTAFQYPLGSAVGYNPAFLVVAERINNDARFSRGRDYLLASRSMLEKSLLKPSFGNNLLSEVLGGVSFDIMEVKLKTDRLTVQQRHYATIKKGYVLVVSISYTTERELQLLKGVLQSVKFH
ncbi:MAG: hypothetical protein HY695_01560 [Deltaproteobacteria bacterium]|nr:hypothetical protein [Deltaproteobacteria bacterium]